MTILTRPIPALTRPWERFWFAPDTARNLAAARIIVGVHGLWHMLSRDFAGMSALPELWVSPPMDRLRYGIVVGHPGLETALHALAVAALIGVILGVFPRTASIIAAVLIYHLAPLETVFRGVEPTVRGLTLTPPMLAILGAARSGDALALVRSRNTSEEPGVSREYGWPRRLMWLLVAQIYLFAFYGKMMLAGPAWGSGENIRLWFIVRNLSDWWRFDFGLWVAEHPVLCATIGALTLVFQGSFIAAVFSRRARYILVPAALFFSAATVFLLNIHVGEAWLVILFVDWDWVMTRVERWLPGPGARGKQVSEAPVPT